MRDRKWTRRDLLTASAASLLFAEPLKAAAPPAAEVTPALIEAAKKEGKLSFYSALELNTAAIMTATFVLARDLGWPYLEKLARQKIMQVQSAADPPKKILLGERAVMADGNDYNLVLLKDQGKPVEVVYPAEGSPLIIVPSGIFRNAPNPNAARLFQSFFFSADTQQMLVDVFAHRSFHGEVKEKGEHIPLTSLKLLKADPAQVQAQSEEIKARYAKIFGV